MRRLIILAEVALGLLFASCTKEEQRTLSVIPAPLKVELQQEVFSLNSETGLYIDASEGDKKILEDYLVASSMNLKPVIAEEGHNVVLKQVAELPEVNSSEGYVLTVTPDQVLIRATSGAGLFYGVQTMLQMVDEKGLPAGVITDEPRFAYRGFMMDVSRHFFDKEFIKKQMDALAYYKLNRLHLHLTDAAGWRLEIKKYPRLAEVGSVRRNADGSIHRGFYTQEQIKEVVAYAAERYITVIPEVELPGHALAALTAYPEYSCTGGPFELRNKWGVEDNVYCAGNDKTFEFLQDILEEVIPLFPGKFFHIGGDECPKVRWNECPKCQKRIKNENLKDAHELQSYFIHRIEKIILAHGKSMIGWDEILEGGLAPSATVMSWRGEEGGIAAASMGHDVIMTPSKWMYIDHGQGAVETEPIAIRFGLPLEKTYSYDPKSPKIPENLRHHVLGAQCNMWTEYAVTPEYTEYLLYPRMLALAELDWTPKEKKDYNSFTRRLDNQLIRLDMHHINYHIPMPEGPMADRIAYTENTTLTFHNSRNYSMVYTTDGSDPQTNSTKYEKPLYLNKDVTVKIATMLPSGKLSPVRSIEVVHEKLMPATEKSTQPGIELRRTEGNLYFVKDLDGAHWSAPKIVKDFEFKPDIEDKGAYCYTGYFEVPADGIYYFSSEMDELRIDGKVIISNDGKLIRHSRTRNSIALQKGKHAFQLLMINNNIGGYLRTWNNKGFILAPEGNELELPKPEKLTH